MTGQPWIVSDPNILNGKPCIRDSRISVEHMFELLASGALIDDVVSRYPNVPREAVLAALDYAEDRFDVELADRIMGEASENGEGRVSWESIKSRLKLP